MEFFAGMVTLGFFLFLLWVTLVLPAYYWRKAYSEAAKRELPDLRAFRDEARDDLHWTEPLQELHPAEEAAIERARVILARQG